MEEGHCLRDQALAYCAEGRRESGLGLGATSLATVMQMVANGYGATLVPQVAVPVEVRDERIKLLRFAPPQPGRTVGLVWRRTSPRKADFLALGEVVTDALDVDAAHRRTDRHNDVARLLNSDCGTRRLGNVTLAIRFRHLHLAAASSRAHVGIRGPQANI